VKNEDITCDVLYLYDGGVNRTALEERSGYGSGEVLNDSCVHAKYRVHVGRKGKILSRIWNMETWKRKVSLRPPFSAS